MPIRKSRVFKRVGKPRIVRNVDLVNVVNKPNVTMYTNIVQKEYQSTYNHNLAM